MLTPHSYPEHCIATAGLCVPYGGLMYGLEEAFKTVDRTIYPEDQYPYGQWAYQKFYETDFEKASAFFDADIPAILRALRLKGDPESVGKPAATAHVVKDGGWMGGAEKPDPKYRHIPLEYTVYDSEETYNEFVAAMEKTGFWTADAWYSNHDRNCAYTLENRKNEGNLEFPVLFVSHSILVYVWATAVYKDPTDTTQQIHATYDTVCATVDNPKIMAHMRRHCKNLKEAKVDASHWVAEEKPTEVNATIAKWLLEEVEGIWPARWAGKESVL
jgi:soluble epoxide hydrolase/lipid-phosphate phosphatase